MYLQEATTNKKKKKKKEATCNITLSNFQNFPLLEQKISQFFKILFILLIKKWLNFMTDDRKLNWKMSSTVLVVDPVLVHDPEPDYCHTPIDFSMFFSHFFLFCDLISLN